MPPVRRLAAILAADVAGCNPADASVISFAAALLLPDYTNRDISRRNTTGLKV
jgi:hypothetical protein